MKNPAIIVARNVLTLVLCLFAVQTAPAANTPKTCCNTQTGEFLAISNEACIAAGHTPFDVTDPASAAATMACFQRTNDIAQEKLRELGLPNASMIDPNNLPTSVEEVLALSPKPEFECCESQTGNFLGLEPEESCRSKGAGFFPDTPEFINEVEACRVNQQAAVSAWNVADYEPNIENGGMEEWRDDNRPEGFTTFGITPELTQGLAQAPAMDIQVAFKDTDAHTGNYSLRLKNFDITAHLPANIQGIARGAVGSVVSPAGAHTCKDPCPTESSRPGGSGNVGSAFTQLASLSTRHVKSHVCGAYKGYIAHSDQLRIDLTLESGRQVQGGSQAIFTRSTGDWIEFLMPLSAAVGSLPGAGSVGISARIEPRTTNDSPYAQAMASLKQRQMSPLTEVNVDSIHFCDPMGITGYHPMIVSGGKSESVPENEEDSLGVQTFVNRDNDDQDGEFDLNDDVVEGDDELVRLQLYLPLNSFGKVRFDASDLDKGKYALWATPNKSVAFSDANKTLEVLELLRTTPDGIRYERDIWVEALTASESVGDMQFRFSFESKLAPDSIMEDTVVLTALDIQKIRFEGQENSFEDKKELDADPNNPRVVATENLRVFPGKRWDQASKKPEDESRNRVDVVATLNLPPVRPVTMFFRSFDLDDPSASDTVVDNEDKPEDNRGRRSAPEGYFPEADTDGLKSVLFEEQEARFEFQVTMQPGDNFRIASSADKKHLKDLENDDTVLTEHGTGATWKITDRNVWRLSEDIAKSGLAEAVLSPGLTVWRKMYMEIDTMRPVRDNAVIGFIQSASKSTAEQDGWLGYDVTIDKNLFDELPDDAKVSNDGVENSFRRGVMHVNGQPLYVERSTAKYFGNDTVTVVFTPSRGKTLKEVIKAEPVGLPFELLTHDSYKNGDPLKPIPLEQMKPAYEPAYVLPVTTKFPHNPISRVPFLLNYQYDNSEYLRSIYEFDNEEHHEDPDFWLVYLLAAFQGMTKEDGDGGDYTYFGLGGFKYENAISGQADSLEKGKEGRGASIFMESGLELQDGHKDAEGNHIPGWRLSDTAPHETGHLFGGAHTDGGLMDDRPENKSDMFSPISLEKIRSHLFP